MRHYLILSILSLALHANAQSINERIVRLTDQLDSIGAASLEANYSHGLRTEYFVTISCDLYDDSSAPIQYKDPQGNILNVTPEQDKRIRDLWRRSRESYDLIRSTCRQIAEEGMESYIWQSHRGGIDSLLYSVALRDYKNPQNDTFTPNLTTNPEWIKYSGAKEGLILKVNPPSHAPNKDAEHYKKNRFFPKSVANVTYRLTIEEQDEDTVYYVDYKELVGVVDKVMRTNGVKSHPILISHDKGAKIEDFGSEINYYDITHPGLDGESHGTVYEIEAADKAKALRELLSAEIGNYVDKHPKINYQYRPMQGYNGDIRSLFSSNNWLIRSEFHTQHLYKLDKYLSCRVLLFQDKQKAYVLVLESVNDFWLPKDWHKLKSWKNGEKEYIDE